MRGPRRAIVLAAGFGSRLAPLTLDCPKPLIPIQGVPLIARVLQQLRSWGVEEVAVNLHHRADLLIAALPGLCPTGMRLTLSYEPGILGTGGALKRLEHFLQGEPFWLCNADVVQELDPSPLLRDFYRHRPLASLWMIPDHGPRTVRVEAGCVQDFRGGGMTFSGLHVISPDMCAYLPEEEEFGSVIEFYEAGMAEGREVRGVVVPGSRWEDAGTPERVLDLQGGSLVIPGAKVAKTARLERALVGPGARIRSRRRAQGLVVAPHHLAPCPKILGEPEAVEILPARGSDRSFFRVHFPDRTLICARSGSQRSENDRTAGHFRFLSRKGIRVPGVETCSADRREVWMEDVGREDLLQRYQQGNAKRNRSDLEKVMELVARFHEVRVPSRLELEPAFGSELYRWEHELFVNEFLTRHDPETDPKPLRKALEEVAAHLHAMPQVLLHRDLQSTNLLWHQGEPVLIDVQGMRRGPRVYDLASFLADPYVNRSRAEQVEGLEIYNRFAGTTLSEAELGQGAVQRLFQALGAYGRLGAQPGTRRFLEYIPAAVAQVSIWAASSPLKSWATAFCMRQAR